MLSFANIALSLSNIFYNSNVSALSYQGSAEIKFTFNPTLSINISSSDLIIDNLTPGTTSDSNIVNVSVATNASHGYTLSATVGDSLHNNTNLTHTNGTNTFDSIATNSSLPNLTTDNTWGYSYKLSNNTNWNNYSGLSNETSKTLVNTDSQIAKPIDFKIAAKASSTQPSGTYTNAINFIAISKPIPKTIEDIVYMQTFGELLPTDLQTVKDSMEEEHTYILKDARDEQDYTIAKLKDGKIWMTKNLNLAGGTTLSSDDTDFESSYTLPTTNGWTTTDNNSKLVMSASSTSGFSAENYAYLYNSNSTTCASNSPCYSYYSWDTATLGSGRSISANYTDTPYSICPKGWKLPTSRNTSAANWQTSSDFYKLAHQYGLDSTTSTAEYDNGFYTLAGPNTTPNFLVTGAYSNTSFFDGGVVGYYWSATSGNGNDYARYMYFRQSGVDTSYNNYRHYGFSVRCLAR